MKDSLLQRLRKDAPLNFAHRGARNHAPENTLAAFERALAHGADGIELDIRLCKTGEWVVLHDATLKRTTNGRGYVRRAPIEKIRRLDAGRYFGEQFRDEPVPTLAEVLKQTHGRCLLNVEIKALPTLPERNLQELIELLHRYHAARRCIISSFNPIVLRRFERLDAHIPTGLLLTANLSRQSPKRLLHKFTNVRAIHLHTRVMTRKIFDQIKALGLFVMVWGADTPPRMREMIDLGVDGIITDEPLELSKILGRYHAA
ncbi:glycerophosphodiester phosphodiesterase [candidate division KSB1 bacterium]|nr:glycerophosphodiester phosphodiesterase [candidate division KSB1 bacterium]